MILKQKFTVFEKKNTNIFTNYLVRSNIKIV